MGRHEQPSRAHLPKQPADARPARSVKAPARAERCPGAAAQLATVHRTLRKGPVLQLEAGVAEAGGRAAGANRTGLPDRLKSGVEALSGLSLDDVRVHRNSPRPVQLDALAFTQGTEIHVAPGQERHLPHEAWHVVQQMQGRVKPTLQLRDGVPINDEAGLEHEADAMGERALQRVEPAEPVQRRPAPASAHAAARQALQLRLVAPHNGRLDRLQIEWNGMLDFSATLPNALRTPIDQHAAQNEAQMRGNFNAQVQALYGLRSAILDSLDAALIAEDSQSDIGWDDIWTFVNGGLLASGLLTATQTQGLGGGHGNAGFRWAVYRVRDNHRIAMGSVPAPNNQHGRTQRALNGTRGMVRTAIVGHNTECGHYRTLAEALPYT